MPDGTQTSASAESQSTEEAAADQVTTGSTETSADAETESAVTGRAPAVFSVRFFGDSGKCPWPDHFRIQKQGDKEVHFAADESGVADVLKSLVESNG